MNTQIKTTGGLSLTPAIAEYIEKRVATIEKFLASDPTTIVHVEIAKTTGHHKHGDIFRAEVRISAKDRDLYVASEKEDLYAAIDDVRDQAYRKLAETKEKQISFVRRGGARVKNMIKGIWGSNGSN